MPYIQSISLVDNRVVIVEGPKKPSNASNMLKKIESVYEEVKKSNKDLK